MELVTLQFSRDQETEADLEGLRILEQASIRPEGMIRFFERLAGQEQHRVELLSTHPMSASRAKRLEEAVTAMPARTWTPFTFDWSQVQASLGRDHAVTGK
jgi:predicted Zn-dependent protease